MPYRQYVGLVVFWYAEVLCGLELETGTHEEFESKRKDRGVAEECRKGPEDSMGVHRKGLELHKLRFR